MNTQIKTALGVGLGLGVVSVLGYYLHRRWACNSTEGNCPVVRCCSRSSKYCGANNVTPSETLVRLETIPSSENSNNSEGNLGTQEVTADDLNATQQLDTHELN